MSRKLAAAAATVLAACVAAGCGGDDKGSSDDDKPVTKATFITSADAICTKTDAEITAAAAKLREKSEKDGTLPKQDVVNFFKGTSLPAYNDLVRQLGALTPPKGDEAKIDGLLATLASAIDTVKADPEKFASTAAEDPFADFNTRAKAYGMKVCGS
jgi:hypothetical protein